MLRREKERLSLRCLGHVRDVVRAHHFSSQAENERTMTTLKRQKQRCYARNGNSASTTCTILRRKTVEAHAWNCFVRTKRRRKSGLLLEQTHQSSMTSPHNINTTRNYDSTHISSKTAHSNTTRNRLSFPLLFTSSGSSKSYLFTNAEHSLQISVSENTYASLSRHHRPPSIPAAGRPYSQ